MTFNAPNIVPEVQSFEPLKPKGKRVKAFGWIPKLLYPNHESESYKADMGC